MDTSECGYRSVPVRTRPSAFGQPDAGQIGERRGDVGRRGRVCRPSGLDAAAEQDHRHMRVVLVGRPVRGPGRRRAARMKYQYSFGTTMRSPLRLAM